MKVHTNAITALAIGVGAMLAGLSPCSAAIINILNADFETDLVADGKAVSPATSWNDAGAPSGGFGATDYKNAQILGETGDINNVGFMNPATSLTQNLVDAGLSPILVAANQTYTILLDTGRRLDDPNAPTFTVNIVETGTGTVIASDTYDGTSQTAGTYANVVFNLSVGAAPTGIGTQARLEFQAGNPTAQVSIDNVSGSVVVPEPSAMALMAVGLLLVTRKPTRGAGRCY